MRTTVIGSYPLPGWLLFAVEHLDEFGPADRAELQDDAVVAAIHDQVAAGLDVITDGEQTRLDFNLSFYGFLSGIELESAPPRRFGPPAHDQRGRHQITGELAAPDGLGVVGEFERLRRLAPAGPTLKASVPGPYTMSGRLVPNDDYPDRWAVTEALLPIVQAELVAVADAGCTEITVDEPSMSCYAHREDPERFVDIFNRTVAPIVGRGRLSTHLCFGNFHGHAVGPRRYAPMFPAFNAMTVDEIHVEMASRELAELDVIATIAEHHDVAVGIVDVKSYFVEPPGADRRARARVPRARARRASLVRARLRAVADGALGGQAEARQHGRRRRTGAPGARRMTTGLIQPAQRDDELLADIAAGRAVRRRPLAPVVARPGRVPRAVGRQPPPARPVPVRLADGEVRRHRQAARTAHGPGRRSGSARHDRRRHVEPQPHRPPRPRDAVATARRQPSDDPGDPRVQPGLRRRAVEDRTGVATGPHPR